MLEKIKKLLDSGCWVEVMYKPVEDWAEFMDKIIAYSSEDVFDRLINWRGDLFFPDLDCITSVKPMGRPLYKYTIGQFVVILDNYEGDTFEIGKEYMVVGQVQGNVNLTKDKTINETFPVDVRCVAPSGKE